MKNSRGAAAPGRPRGGTAVAVSLEEDDWPSLVRFAAISLVDRTELPRSELARRMGKSASNFHMALFGRRGGSVQEPLTKTFVQDLQRALYTTPTGPDPDSAARRRPATMLTGLYEELAEGEPDVGVRVHAAWFPDLCKAGPARGAVEALMRGEALWDMLKSTRGRAEQLRIFHGDHDDAVRQTIKDLLSIAGSSKGAPAVQVLARLGIVALPEIEREIYQSPVGFRCVRVLGRMLWRVHLRARHNAPAPADPELLDAIERLLIRLLDKPPADPYPARNFYVEAMRYAPERWDWVLDVVAGRARDTNRPVRERMYAMFVVAERAPDALDDLLRTLERVTHDDAGIIYAAQILREHQNGGRYNGWLDDTGAVSDGTLGWPPVGGASHALRNVITCLRATPERVLPRSVRPGLEVLITEALLTLDGTRRRRSCDVITIAQLDGPAARAIAEILRAPSTDPDASPRWLREHAAFVIGYLQHHDGVHALSTVVRGYHHEDPSVVHAAAWGLGDTCGRGSWVDHRDHVPVAALTEVLRAGADSARHAAVFALATTRQPGGTKALREVLEDSRWDKTTRGIARWGIWLADAERTRHRPDQPVYIANSRSLVVSE